MLELLSLNPTLVQLGILHIQKRTIHLAKSAFSSFSFCFWLYFVTRSSKSKSICRGTRVFKR